MKDLTPTSRSVSLKRQSFLKILLRGKTKRRGQNKVRVKNRKRGPWMSCENKKKKKTYNDTNSGSDEGCVFFFLCKQKEKRRRNHRSSFLVLNLQGFFLCKRFFFQFLVYPSHTSSSLCLGVFSAALSLRVKRSLRVILLLFLFSSSLVCNE